MHSIRRRSLIALAPLTPLLSRLEAAGKNYIAFVASTGRNSKGIYAFRFDAASGKLDAIGPAGEAPGTSFLALHPNGRYLYAVSGANGGEVIAFRIDPKSGQLALLNRVPSVGAGPCYVRVDQTGRNAMIANYGGGSVAVLPIEADGKLREASSFIQHAGTVADPKRQGGPHAHSINPSPDNRFLIAADLGLDQLLVYSFNPASGTITPHNPSHAKVAPRSGPRHFAFHPSGRHAYAINEISCTVTAFDYDAKAGVLKEIQTASTLPAGVEVLPSMSTAEVQVHPSGKFLYGSNRGHDTIAVFTIAPKGTLTLVENVSTQGKTPRNFAIDPTGAFLLAENQGSNNIVVFRIDKKTGRLTATGQTVEVDSPMCIKFLPVK